MMKYFVILLLSLCAAPALAQTRETNPPIALDGKPSEFLLDFQNAVKYLADNTNPPAQRRQFAKSFANQFARGAVIQVMNGGKTISLTPIDYFNRLIDLNYDKVEIGFIVNKQSPFKKNEDNWWTTQYEITQSFKGSRGGQTVAADFTIKTIDLYFLYTPSNRTWTKKYGHVMAYSSMKIPVPSRKPKFGR